MEKKKQKVKRIRFLNAICLGNPLFGFDFLMDRHTVYTGDRKFEHIIPFQIYISITLGYRLFGIELNLGKFYKE